MAGKTTSKRAGPDSLAGVAATLDPFLHLLHVDDSLDDQVLFQAACKRGGVRFNWQVADSAEAGISYLTTLVAQSKKTPVCWPDVILLDAVMPVRGGEDVLEFVRATAELRTIPVVIFTGHPGERHKNWIDAGAHSVSHKPLEFEQLVQFAKRLYTTVLQLKQSGGGTVTMEL